MENDRELLELAAKASGHQIVGWNEQHGVDVAVMKDGSFWQPLLENPITDCMGDALRLAVKLRMEVDAWGAGASAVVKANGRAMVTEPHYGDDPDRATRRAIVRAAAEIGRAME